MLNYFKKNWPIVGLLFLSVFINSASIIYYFYRFNGLIALISLILAFFFTGLFIYFIISRPNQQEIDLPKTDILESGEDCIFKNKKKSKILKIITSVIIFVIFVFLFFILSQIGSFSAIASPWLFIPWYFWLLVGVLILLLFLSFYQKNSWSYIFVILWYFLFFSISVFVYKIAFGYDQLLHERAMIDILSTGFISPKTIYYVGQYVLELSLFKILPLSIENINRLLMPVLSAVLIPLTFYFNFKKRGFTKIIWPLALLLLLPFSIFTYTVPQNLAFLFLVILILFSSNIDFIKKKYNFIFLFSLAVSIFFVHPLAGVPAIIFVFILLIKELKMNSVIKLPFNFLRIGEVLCYLGQIIILPILLIIVGGCFFVFKIDWSVWSFKFLGQENIFLNFIYFFSANGNWWLLLLFVLSAIFVFKKGQVKLKIFFYNSTALMLSYFLSLFIDFPFLSSVDKDSYAQRILIISFLFLLPIFYEMLVDIIKKVKTEKLSFKIVLLLFIAGWCLISLYINYPRKDNYFNSRSFSVSDSDFIAVKYIEEHKTNDNYIVLANQQVGAAAIKEYGFKRYYDSWFYYSVQTGGLLYDYYLKIIADPNKELAMEVLDKTGADECLVVVNDYWWAFDRIVEEMKVTADDYYSMDEGNIYVFRFVK
jgi:hypothetical protein